MSFLLPWTRPRLVEGVCDGGIVRSRYLVQAAVKCLGWEQNQVRKPRQYLFYPLHLIFGSCFPEYFDRHVFSSERRFVDIAESSTLIWYVCDDCWIVCHKCEKWINGRYVEEENREGGPFIGTDMLTWGGVGFESCDSSCEVVIWQSRSSPYLQLPHTSTANNISSNHHLTAVMLWFRAY